MDLVDQPDPVCALVDQMATDLHAEIRQQFLIARLKTEQRFREIQNFTNRSIGQRRRYLRARHIKGSIEWK